MTIGTALMGAVRSLTGRRKEDKSLCSRNIRRFKNQRIITLNCKNCGSGLSSLSDPGCRENIFHILNSETEANRLVLSHLFERDYERENLDFLYLLARFINSINSYRNSLMSKRENCSTENTRLLSILYSSASDPIGAFFELRNELRALHSNNGSHASVIENCGNDLILLLEKMVSCVPELADRLKDPETDNYGSIKPLVRPGFSTSRIYISPPTNTEFLERYEVQRCGGRIMPITMYSLTDRPESLYFAIPVEYNNMRSIDIEIIESARKKLMRHRPDHVHFAESSNSREYFSRLGKRMILEELNARNLRFEPEEIHVLSDILAKYTTGFGILEDVLSDERVTDVYVNSPADLNPVHVVIDGEECSSNIYLSQVNFLK